MAHNVAIYMHLAQHLLDCIHMQLLFAQVL